MLSQYDNIDNNDNDNINNNCYYKWLSKINFFEFYTSTKLASYIEE